MYIVGSEVEREAAGIRSDGRFRGDLLKRLVAVSVKFTVFLYEYPENIGGFCNAENVRELFPRVFTSLGIF